jgi:uncharacterized membrane protein
MLTSPRPSAYRPSPLRHRSRWRSGAPAGAGVVAVLLLFGALVLVGRGPAVTDLASMVAPPADGIAVPVRVVLLASTALVAGLGVTRAVLSRVPVASSVRAWAWVGAAAVVLACATAVVTGISTRPVAVLQALLALAVPILIGGPILAVAVPGVALAVVLGIELGSARSGLPLGLDMIFAAAVALLLGVSVFGAVVLRGPGRAAGDHPDTAVMVRTAVGAGTVAVAATVAQLLISGPRAGFDLLHTGYGLLTVAATVLSAAVTATWLLVVRPVGRPRAAELSRLAACGVVLALLATATLATLPRPAAAPDPGRPLLRPLDLGLRHLAVLVVPMRPGLNLVHIGDAGDGAAVPSGHQHGAAPAPVVPRGLTVSTGGHPVEVASRAAAPGGWAVVDIPAGADQLTVAGDGTTAVVPIDVGTEPADPQLQQQLAGPDGAECASALLGGLMAGPAVPAPTECPAQELTASDAAALDDTVTFLAGRGITALDLVTDSSPRGVAAADRVRARAAALRLPISSTPVATDTRLVLSGWEQARTALADGGVVAGGTVLAPWLLTGRVLEAASSEVLALTFNPQSLDPRQYATTVATAFPGESPSAAGYLAWAAVRNSPLDARVSFYGAAPVNVPMGGPMDDMPMGGSGPQAWFSGGAIVPINPPLAAVRPSLSRTPDGSDRVRTR